MAGDGARRQNKKTALEATVFDGENTGRERAARRTYQGEFWRGRENGGYAVLGEAAAMAAQGYDSIAVTQQNGSNAGAG